MGRCYEHGLGVASSASEAVYWYEQAARKEHPGAQASLGRCFERGVGVEVNHEEAARLYGCAARQVRCGVVGYARQVLWSGGALDAQGEGCAPRVCWGGGEVSPDATGALGLVHPVERRGTWPSAWLG